MTQDNVENLRGLLASLQQAQQQQRPAAGAVAAADGAPAEAGAHPDSSPSGSAP